VVYVVHAILGEGYNPDVRDDNGWTPLRKAVWHGRHACVSCLLNNGANVNYRGGPDDSALEISSYRGQADIVMMLLERGATTKNPALHKAPRKGHRLVVDLLVKARANVPLRRPLPATLYSTPLYVPEI
jgi:ankyrin repeat protein